MGFFERQVADDIEHFVADKFIGITNCSVGQHGVING